MNSHENNLIDIELTDSFEDRQTNLRKSVNKFSRSKELAKTYFDDALDSACEFGWDMGIVDERSRIFEIIDSFKSSLTKDEEVAKFTLEVLKRMIEEENGRQ